MIEPWPADLLRYANVALGLILALLSGFAIVVSAYWDQRVRFAVFASFAVLLTAGHLSALGRVGSYRLPILAAVLICAVVSSTAYVHREGQLWKARRTMTDTPGGARDARAGHVPVSGPGPAPGSSGDLGRRPGATLGDLAPGVAQSGEDRPGVARARGAAGTDSDRPEDSGPQATQDPGAPRR